MTINDKRNILNFSSSMGCYVYLAQVYLEVAWAVVHLSKKDIGLSLNLHVLYDDL